MVVQSRQRNVMRLVIAVGIVLSMLLAGGAPSDFAHGIASPTDLTAPVTAR